MSDSPTGGTDTNAQVNDNNFTVSLSETTDGGMTISSSFKLMDENAAAGDIDAGLTLAFTDGSKLDVINAGNASGSHAVSIPGSAGAEGVTVTSTNSAVTGLDFMTASTVQGVEYHTASDFLADGLKMSFSASTDSGAAATATAACADTPNFSSIALISSTISMTLFSAIALSISSFDRDILSSLFNMFL